MAVEHRNSKCMLLHIHMKELTGNCAPSGRKQYSLTNASITLPLSHDLPISCSPDLSRTGSPQCETLNPSNSQVRLLQTVLVLSSKLLNPKFRKTSSHQAPPEDKRRMQTELQSRHKVLQMNRSLSNLQPPSNSVLASLGIAQP
jgi:hypothetical protein